MTALKKLWSFKRDAAGLGRLAACLIGQLRSSLLGGGIDWLSIVSRSLTIVRGSLASLGSGLLLLLHSDHLLVLWLHVAILDEEVVGFRSFLIQVGWVSEEVLDVDRLSFKQHSSDLSSQVAEHLTNGLVDVVSDEVLLFVRLHFGETVKISVGGRELVDLVLNRLLRHGLHLLRHLVNLLLGLRHIHLLHLLHLGHVHLLLGHLLRHLCNLILIILLVSVVHLLVVVLASLWVSSVLELSSSAVLI